MNNLNWINLSWYKGGRQKQPSEQPTRQHLAVTVKKKKNLEGGGGKCNPMRSSINDQFYFYAKYNNHIKKILGTNYLAFHMFGKTMCSK